MEYVNILASSYKTDNWINLLHNIFGANFKAASRPESVSVDTQTAKQARQLGEITLNDGNTIAVYETLLQDNVQIARNRVALRNLLRAHWGQYDGAFIASYKQTDTDWRFSFVSETRQWSADGTKY